jgi:hypothetical protein
VPHKKELVGAARLRQIYAAQFEGRIASGEYTLNVIRSRPPAKGGNLPDGTHSEISEIINNQGIKIGTVHAMRLPDGTIGGSGRYDPKELMVGQTRYLLDPKEG